MDGSGLDSRIEAYLDSNWEQIVDDIERLVRIESVEDMDTACHGSPFGAGPRQALDAALDIAGRMGFSTSDLDGYMGIADFCGSSRDQLAIIGHVDVVAAGPGWNFDPFALTRQDGYLIGRGTIDDKAPFLVAMHAVRFWIEQGARFPYTIRMLVGVNEETRMDDVRRYLDAYPDPAFAVTPDAEFPVCYGEKGVVNLLLSSREIEGGLISEIEGGTAVNAVPGFASAVVVADAGRCPGASDVEAMDLGGGIVRIRAVGKSAHASTPELGESAIGILVQYLLDNGICNADERDFLQLMMRCIDHTDGSGLGIDCADSDFGPLTLACGIVGKKGPSITLTLDARFPTTTSASAIADAVSKEASAIGAEVCTTMFKEPFVCDPDSAAVQALLDAYNEVTGEDAEPFTMGGGTYARMFSHGASFGIEKPWEDKPDWVGGMHGPDEAVSEESLKEEFRIYVKTIEKLMHVDLGRNGPMPAGRLGASTMLCEGAMGTMLQRFGVDVSGGVMHLNAEDPRSVEKVHRMYRDAGADCAITNSFSPCTSDDPSKIEQAAESVAASVKLARNAGYGIVLGDMGPTGELMEPLGNATFDAQYRAYRTHADALVAAGADALLLETFIDLADARCALIAALDAVGAAGTAEAGNAETGERGCAKAIPVISSFSFKANGRTPLSSTSPAVAALVSQMLGAGMTGANCGLGPEEILPIVEEMSQATCLPLIVQPNAGIPIADADGNAVYPGTPQEMAALTSRFASLGCTIIGSCCGSTPEFTGAIAEELENLDTTRRARGELFGNQVVLASTHDTLVACDGRIDCLDGCMIDCVPNLDKWEVLDGISEAPMLLRFEGSAEALELALKCYPGVAVVCVDEMDAGCCDAARLAKRYGAYLALEADGADELGVLAKVAAGEGLDASRVLRFDGSMLYA